MGIQGLHQQLKPIQNPVSLRRYEGQTLGIDGYAWLHRGACSCAYELVMGLPTERYLQFFIKRLALLKSFHVDPYIVFDGDSISVKKETECKRREKRIESRSIAERLWKSGERKNAMDYFQKCVDITPEMAKCIIDYCKNEGIKYIVAPFEADAQMVYLEKQGLIQGIISEDSDLLIFGCSRLITKLNDYGECIEICREDFKHLPRKFPLGQLGDEELRTMVCLSGCDYTSGIPRVGLLTAVKLVHRLKTMQQVLLHIEREGKLKVPKDFVEEYTTANYAFQFQRVFCPIRQKLVTLNEIPADLLEQSGVVEALAKSIGTVVERDSLEKVNTLDPNRIDHEIHKKVALGELSPYDCKKPLVNRERKLQMTSKSEVNLDKPSIPIKPINSFFKANQRETTVPKPGIQGETVSTTFPSHNKAVKSSSLSCFNMQTGLSVPTVQAFPLLSQANTKLENLVTNRKLGIQQQVQSSSIASKSRFFSSKTESQEHLLPSCDSNDKLETEQRGEESPLPSTQDDAETDIPSSALDTEIPSSLVQEIMVTPTSMDGVDILVEGKPILNKFRYRSSDEGSDSVSEVEEDMKTHGDDKNEKSGTVDYNKNFNDDDDDENDFPKADANDFEVTPTPSSSPPGTTIKNKTVLTGVCGFTDLKKFRYLAGATGVASDTDTGGLLAPGDQAATRRMSFNRRPLALRDSNSIPDKQDVCDTSVAAVVDNTFKVRKQRQRKLLSKANFSSLVQRPALRRNIVVTASGRPKSAFNSLAKHVTLSVSQEQKSAQTGDSSDIQARPRPAERSISLLSRFVYKAG